MLHKNLCAKQRKKIFFARVMLDTMAGGLFLLKGQWSTPVRNPGIQGFPGDEESLSGS